MYGNTRLLQVRGRAGMQHHSQRKLQPRRRSIATRELQYVQEHKAATGERKCWNATSLSEKPKSTPAFADSLATRHIVKVCICTTRKKLTAARQCARMQHHFLYTDNTKDLHHIRNAARRTAGMQQILNV